jgi:hypothetical protein
MKNKRPMQPPQAMVTVANLDVAKVYWGVQAIPKDSLTSDHVPVPPDCDLVPGRYRWSMEHSRFDPLTTPVAHPSQVSTEQAVCELAKFAQSLGAKSEALSRYIVQFETSIDQQRDIDGVLK